MQIDFSDDRKEVNAEELQHVQNVFETLLQSEQLDDITFHRLLENILSISTDKFYSYINTIDSSILVNIISNYDKKEFLPLISKILISISTNTQTIPVFITSDLISSLFSCCSSYFNDLNTELQERIFLVFGNLYLISHEMRNTLNTSEFMQIILNFETNDFILKETYYWLISVILSFPNEYAQQLVDIAWLISCDGIDSFAAIGLEALYSASKWTDIVKIMMNSDKLKINRLLETLTNDDSELRNNCVNLINEVVESLDYDTINALIQCIRIDKSNAAANSIKILSKHANPEIIRILSEQELFKTIQDSEFIVKREFLIRFSQINSEIKLSSLLDAVLFDYLDLFVDASDPYEQYCVLIILGRLYSECLEWQPVITHYITEKDFVNELLSEYDIPSNISHFENFIQIIANLVEHE